MAARHLVVLSAVCAARGATPPVQLPEGFHSDPDGSAIAVGWHHTCALRFTEGADFGGIAECWGHDVNGETKAPEDQIFIQLSAGHHHTCGVGVDERIHCWGNKREAGHSPSGLFQQVAAGEFHSCGLYKDGPIKCWGADGRDGRLAAPPGKFVQVAAGARHTCGLRPTGLVECWGAKKGGASPPEGVRFKQIALASSAQHACGVEYETGALRCWGEDTNGQAPAASAAGVSYAQVSVGGTTTCAILEATRKIECLGRRTDLQLQTTPLSRAERERSARKLLHRQIQKDGSEDSPKARRLREALENLPDEDNAPLVVARWEQISVGFHHQCAVTEDAELKCWGPWTGPRIPSPSEVPPDFVVA